MAHPTDQAPEFLSAFARQRQQLLHQAAAILSPSTADGDVNGHHPSGWDGKSATTVPRLSQLLVASLEILKVAEEEMLEQQATQLTERAEMERQVTFHRTLFELAPAALLLTTTDGSIRAANRAATAILLRDTYHLEGKPISGIVPRESRAEFREQLHRISITAGASNWTFTVERPTDMPLRVVAAVHMAPSALAGSPSLLWHLRAAD